MLLIDATLPALVGQGKNVDNFLTQKWTKVLGSLGFGRVKRPGEPVVSPEALYGLDGIFVGDYPRLFKKLRRLSPMEVVFGNEGGLATALAVSWLEEGGSGIVCSVAGVGGLPVLEQLRLMLHLTGRMLLPKEDKAFGSLRCLYEEMTGTRVDLFQPILGRGIFAGESGVHVDSWAKDPRLYEPFSPELVDGFRVLAVGRHSGQGALRLKCCQLGLSCPQEKISSLLEQVRLKALAMERSLTDEEFSSLAQNCLET